MKKRNLNSTSPKLVKEKIVNLSVEQIENIKGGDKAKPNAPPPPPTSTIVIVASGFECTGR